MSVSMRRKFWTLDFRDQHGVRRCIKTEWSTDKDKPKAQALLDQYLGQIEAGRFEAKSEQRDFTKLAEDFIAQLDVRTFTRKEYGSIINNYLRGYFNKMKLRAITPREVEKFRAWMQGRKRAGSDKPLAVSTINKSLTLLSMMLKYAVGHQWLDSNPCNHVRKLKTSIDHNRKKLEGNILTWAECLLLFDAAGSLRDRALFRMAIETGMRQGELLGLRWADIDWESGRVFVRQSCRVRSDSQVKTAASMRSIQLTKALLRELRVWRVACPKAEPEAKVQDLAFPNAAGGFEDAHNLLRRSFHPALRRAKLRTIRFHDLRHICASLLLAAGVGIKEVQAQLGHASAQVTLDVYGHLIPGGSSAAADTFETLAGGGTVVAESAALDVPERLTHASGEAPEAVRTGSEVVAGLVPQRGFEPLTHALRMRCSTN
jgi:integrase